VHVRAGPPVFGRRPVTLGTILLLVVIVLLIGAIPAWPHSREWGYYPSGTLSTILIVLVILMLLGRV
jgi:hypothetical protein